MQAQQASQRANLEALYDSLGGPRWTNSSLWLNSTAHHCTWVGVGCCTANGTVPGLSSGATGNADGPDITKELLLGACCCNVTGAVAKLELSYNGLYGELPGDMAALAPTVQHFQIGGNAVFVSCLAVSLSLVALLAPAVSAHLVVLGQVGGVGVRGKLPGDMAALAQTLQHF